MGEEGASKRAHLEQAAKQTGQTLAAVLGRENLLECPHLLTEYWGMFTELNAARGGNGFGPNPISHAEIAAFAALHGVALAGWEVRVLRMLDSLYLHAAVSQLKAQQTESKE